MRHLNLLLVAALGCASATHAPDAPSTVAGPATRAERTGWLETSAYADVIAFLDSLGGVTQLHRTTFGSTVEGRALPVVVVGAASASARDVHATGRTRVLVFANIHAGEVEGKEVALVLLRELAQGRHAAWLDSLVLLVAPIYNADGNERVSTGNRPEQHGPFGGVGTRENAQGLDLNRDHMKLDSPEARALVRLFVDYDPHVVVDLHTTNGTHHAYHLTYAPPLHPATDDGIVSMLRERWLPRATADMAEEGWRAWYYGNLPIREWGMTGERGWYSFDYRPRFNTHYVGLRNRFGILSEAYSYASFEERVLATRAFVVALLDWAASNASAIRRAAAAADDAPLPGHRLPLRARLVSSGDTVILLGAVEERVNPVSGLPYLARLDSVAAERMPNHDRFAPTEWETAPRAYFVAESATQMLDLLRAHGIELTPPPTGAVESIDYEIEMFVIDSTRVATRPFQGHLEREVFGRWCATVGHVDAEWTVDMEQPLARLAFMLLEPRSPDGAVDWNFADAEIDQGWYPVSRAATDTVEPCE